jgi:hypothetical protein
MSALFGRPFDDQNQLRIRLETDAVFLILKRIETGLYRAVISPVHYKEVGAIRETSERLEMESLLRRLDKSCDCDLIQTRHHAEALDREGIWYRRRRPHRFCGTVGGILHHL